MPLVLLFWLVSSGWLLVTKIMPSLTPGSPPGYQAFYTEENRLVPVAWTVLLNDRPLGWATSQSERTEEGGIEVESLLHFERLPIKEVLPAWATKLLPQSVDADAAMPVDARGQLSIDRKGDLRSFRSTVNLPAPAGSVFLDGRVDKGEVTVDVRANGMSYTVYRQLPNRLTIRDELMPQAMLPALARSVLRATGSVAPAVGCGRRLWAATTTPSRFFHATPCAADSEALKKGRIREYEGFA